MSEDNHAISNARAWLATILEYEAGRQAFADDAESVTVDGDTFETLDDLRDRIQELPLSVQVRDGWRSPGDRDDVSPEEYEILLSTGGPALRIFGELGQYCEPDDYPALQYQDWGTPWTSLDLSNAEREAVAAFARCFYFGE